MKNTIIISAATCLAVHALIWMLGPLVWPLVWAASGLGLLKLGDFLSSETATLPIKFMAAIMGPVMLVHLIAASFHDGVFDFRKLNLPKFPKIRNPFVWPND
jgi:hypothetical protein